MSNFGDITPHAIPHQQTFQGFPTTSPAFNPMNPNLGIQSGNPLSKHFRIPGVHVKLPTNGMFMPSGTIQLTSTGEVPVYPMAAKDELLLKSPDALMNGYAIEELLKSCVPCILAPRMIATQDLDVLLLAIRAATYGDVMNLEADCPKCKTLNEIKCNLPALLGTMQFVDSDNLVRLQDDVVAYVRPYNLHNATIIAMASYEETRKLQTMEDRDPPASVYERNKAMSLSVDRINKVNLDMLGDCILKIVIPGNEVNNPQFIQEFIANVPKPWVEAIDKKLRDINQKGIDKSLHIKCSNEECGHEWTTEVEFNPSNFFDAASSR